MRRLKSTLGNMRSIRYWTTNRVDLSSIADSKHRKWVYNVQEKHHSLHDLRQCSNIATFENGGVP